MFQNILAYLRQITFKSRDFSFIWYETKFANSEPQIARDFKRKVLHRKNTKTENREGVKEIVARRQLRVERVLVKAGQVTSKPDTLIATAILRGGQIES